jgi:hypothetical protein
MRIFDTFKNYVNLKYGLSDPNTPANKKTMQTDYGLERGIDRMEQRCAILDNKGENTDDIKKTMEQYRDRQEIKSKIDKIINQRVVDGLIKNRDEIISYFENQGITVNRNGKDYISIKFEDSDKAMRLKGVFYSEGFRGIESIGQDGCRADHGNKKIGNNHPEDSRGRLEELRNLVQRGMETRARRFTAQYRIARKKHKEEGPDKCWSHPRRDNSVMHNDDDPTDLIYKYSKKQTSATV